MLSGRRLDLLDPSPLDVEIEDIAHGLARVARWNGQTRGPAIFSVAQHCLLVADIADALAPGADAQTRLMVLLHDAPEYVIGDMISPFKAVIGESYREVESRLLAAVHLRFGLPATTPAVVRALTKRADRIAAFFEATELAGFSIEEARPFFGDPRSLPKPLASLSLEPLPADAAQGAFLARFAALTEPSQQGSRHRSGQT
jgi:5'-deoxynucleotidase YfbR-like HD superfamily hydrolase